MHEKRAPLVTAVAPRELTPDMKPGWYVYHDSSGDTGLVELARPHDRLLAHFPGCDEEFEAEPLDGLFEGPLSPAEREAAGYAIERLSAPVVVKLFRTRE